MASKWWKWESNPHNMALATWIVSQTISVRLKGDASFYVQMNENLLYSIENSTQYSVMTYMGRKF